MKAADPLWRYAVAILATGLAVGAKIALDPVIGTATPFVILLAPVIVSAWHGGLGPGLLATGLAALAAIVLPVARAYAALRLTVFVL
ncbi:MAG: DUF4118 domain-containing protein, partial [Candidatus Rokubacteria bacterium]|nr:DUF4118 domain-containing protein [Candidatus Rokubacteria bacterium]